MKIPNMAVIGSFWLTEEMIKAVNGRDDIRYYSQYSRDLSRAIEFGKNKGAVKFYDDLEDLAGCQDIDIVYIASPNAFHYEQTKKLLMSGKHVLCEKPATLHADQFRELCAIADNKGVIYMEAMMNIHQDSASKLKEVITKGGDVISARIDFNQRSSKLDRWKAGENFSTFSKETGGGALNDLGVYITSLVTFLFGKPADVFAKASYNESGADMKDTAVLIYDGFEVICTMSKLAESIIRSEILCENVSVRFDNVSRLENIEKHTSEEIKRISEKKSFVECMNYELDDFLSYMKGSREGYMKCRALTEMSLELLERIRNATSSQTI